MVCPKCKSTNTKKAGAPKGRQRLYCHFAKSKVNAQEVNRWADEHSDEIEAYSDAQGHVYRQNVGKDLSVIKWDEKQYRAYEWPEGHF